jgi:hypothetical protein
MFLTYVALIFLVGQQKPAHIVELYLTITYVVHAVIRVTGQQLSGVGRV